LSYTRISASTDYQTKDIVSFLFCIVNRFFLAPPDPTFFLMFYKRITFAGSEAPMKFFPFIRAIGIFVFG